MTWGEDLSEFIRSMRIGNTVKNLYIFLISTLFNVLTTDSIRWKIKLFQTKRKKSIYRNNYRVKFQKNVCSKAIAKVPEKRLQKSPSAVFWLPTCSVTEKELSHTHSLRISTTNARTTISE